MKDMALLHSYFVRALSVVLAIVASGGRDNCLSGQIWYAAAFCSHSHSYSYSIGRRIVRRESSIFAGRGNIINEWISNLEEEFNRDSGEDNNNNKNINRDEDALRPAPLQRPFQTPVKTHTNVIDLLDQIDTAPSNDLTIVLLFAHYCKTCHRAFAPFKQLANDSANSLHFVRFETSVLSPKQFLSLGIDRVPFLQIYRNGICVASFSATQKTSRTSRRMVLRPRLLGHIDACLGRSLTDWLAFRENHDLEIEANKAARATIRETAAVAGKSDSWNARNSDNGGDDDDEKERLYLSVRTLTSESDLLRLIHGSEPFGGEEEENGIVVVMFHSHFDPSCHRAQHKFRKITNERLRQQQQQMQKQGNRTTTSCMARIESSVLPDKTLQLLGIQRYPHIQIYSSSNRPHKNDRNAETETKTKTKQCVASFSIPRSFLFARMLHESLDVIDQRTLEEWTKFYHKHREEIEFQQLALEGIARERERQHYEQQ